MLPPTLLGVCFNLIVVNYIIKSDYTSLCHGMCLLLLLFPPALKGCMQEAHCPIIKIQAYVT